ncbi:MAG: prephenate dehydrogenase/arogenate dehydrogenase family protein [Paramuribaculum sp.]|nr:prephenate dehydrogenase/arogenate dehydrogenase family protein [Paramuribaculum sp.]MDE6489452.1 prephenate dehydrogenase/arogenate dehydrogenase family protein [Paramuribaculum sp.]
MKILIMGAGKMGTFFSDLLQPDNEVAVFDTDPTRLRFTYGVLRFSDLTEVEEFEPEMVLNAVTVKNTIVAFNHILPHIPKECILSDIASVKTGLPEFYATCGHPFVSTHPMFGPTFASLSNLADENAIIISEGSDSGRDFFRQIYSSLHLNIVDYTFDEHDLTIAYSLSIPFASTLVFGSVMKHQDAPGTTFKRHLAIARGLMSEDDYLLSEILFNPNTPRQLRLIRDKLDELQQIVTDRDAKAMKRFLDTVRDNLE